ncbi:hypothetical protein DS745_12405 [Anaerobacillus alkaliphilus]|uniref:YtxH domain-containing protein n=1 Tax=Anaerobacillus alkaliphilus TaxID=1548597 RepID=A0A4Q0VSK5_9BACI|nr:hypothetical protein [Anaerobacillus alkaliphilus]RXJ00326.1 hypothetical protein DS745_12405 [Anaerobacillus alkaliphilus]
MEESRKKLIIRSAVIGGVVGSIVVALRSKKNLSSCINSCYEKTTDILKFVNENRSEIIDQLKTTSDKVTRAIDDTNNDLKALSSNIKHLKDSSAQMILTVQDTKDHLVTMYETCKQKYETPLPQQEEKKDE